MDNAIKILTVLITLTTTRISAQQTSLPYLKDVEMRSIVNFDPIKNIYFYSYAIKNSEASNGVIGSFEIDVSRDSLSTVALDDIGLQFKNAFLKNWYKNKSVEILNGSVPISFPSLPQYGEGALTARETARLSAGPIGPGQEKQGFVISSKGLPGIRNFVVVPPFDPYQLYPSIEDVADPDSLDEVIERDREAVKFRGWTIGPTAPPLNFVATVWCDTLLSYTRQSVALGWLKTTRDDDCDEDEQPSDGVAKNIEKRIQKAKKELMKGDSVKARKELEKLVKKVEKIYAKHPSDKKSEEAEKKKHDSDITMTSEAYALLKYNTEYLIERLPEKGRK